LPGLCVAAKHAQCIHKLEEGKSSLLLLGSILGSHVLISAGPLKTSHSQGSSGMHH